MGREWNRRATLAIALAVGLLYAAPPAAGLATGAHVDRTFGTNGTAGTVLPPRYEVEGVNRLTPEADGGVLAATEDVGREELRRFGPERRLGPPIVAIGRNGRAQRKLKIPGTHLGNAYPDAASGLGALQGRSLILAWTGEVSDPEKRFHTEVAPRRIHLG